MSGNSKEDGHFWCAAFLRWRDKFWNAICTLVSCMNKRYGVARCCSTARCAHRRPFVWVLPWAPSLLSSVGRGLLEGLLHNWAQADVPQIVFMHSCSAQSPNSRVLSSLILLLGELFKKMMSLTKIQLTSLHNTLRVRQQWEQQFGTNRSVLQWGAPAEADEGTKIIIIFFPYGQTGKHYQ